MSAKEHDHDHDHATTMAHDNTASHHDGAARPAAGDARARLLEVAARARGQGAVAARAAHQGVRAGNDDGRADRSAVAPQLLPPHGREHGPRRSRGSVGCCRYEKEEIVPLARRPEAHVPGTDAAVRDDVRARRRRRTRSSRPRSRVARSTSTATPSIRSRVARSSRARSATPARDVRAGVDPPPLRSGSLAEPARTGARARRWKRSGRRSPTSRKNARAAGARVLSEATSSPTILALRAPSSSSRASCGTSTSRSRGTTSASARAPRSVASLRPIAQLDRAETIVTIDCDIFVEHPGVDEVQPRLRAQPPQGRLARHRQDEPPVVGRERHLEHRRDGGSPPRYARRARPAVRARARRRARRWRRRRQRVPQGDEGRAVHHGARRGAQGERGPRCRHRRSPSAARGPRGRREDQPGDRRRRRRRSTTSRIRTPSARTHVQAITQLAQDMAAGRVHDADHPRRQPGVRRTGRSRLRERAREGRRRRSTSASTPTRRRSKSTWHVPKAHFLEAWGDARTWDGTITDRAAADRADVRRSVVGRAALDAARRRARPARSSSRKRTSSASASRRNWRQSVHDGFVAGHRAAGRARARVDGAPPFKLTPSQQAGSKPQERRPRGRVSLLECDVRRSLREQRVAAGDARTSSRRSPGTTTRSSRRRRPQALGIDERHDDHRQGRRSSRSSCPATRCPVRRGTRSASCSAAVARRPAASVEASGGSRSPSAGTRTRSRTTKGFDIATRRTVSRDRRALRARERPGALELQARQQQAHGTTTRADSGRPRGRARSPS